jgi:hypothetical protein
MIIATRKGKMNSETKQLQETNNNLFTSEQQANTSYSTQKLTDLFLDLERDGITAIGFSLLVDLVNDRAAN